MFLRKYKTFMRTTAAVMSFCMGVYPFHAFGITASAEGNAGKAFGKGLAEQFQMPSESSGTLNFGDSGTISFSDLYPKDNDAQLNRFSTDQLSGIDNEDDLLDAGYSSQRPLFEDAQNYGNPYDADPAKRSAAGPATLSGAAYQVVLGVSAAREQVPDLRKDPLIQAAVTQGLTNQELLDSFGDCTDDTTIMEGERDVRLPDYQTCERIVGRGVSISCEINHNYDAAVIRHHSGGYAPTPCGEGCFNLAIGRVGDNYWSGWCTEYEHSAFIEVVNPVPITKATLTRAKWDDYMQVWVGEPGNLVKAWESAPFPEPIYENVCVAYDFNGTCTKTERRSTGRYTRACELSTSWDRNPGTDLTRFFKNVEPGTVIQVKVRVSVAGSGEGFGNIRFSHDPALAVTDDNWIAIPPECIAHAEAVLDGAADGHVQCVADPRNSTGCTVVNGITLCEKHLQPSPLPTIPNLCKKVSVKADYDFYKGNMDCFIDANGEMQCPFNDGDAEDNCKPLEEDPKCSFVSSECVGYAEGTVTGNCYLFNDTYDCGESFKIPTYTENTEYSCNGPIRCMGSDCFDPTNPNSAAGDFSKAAALLDAAQAMSEDMVCEGEEGSITGCRVFPGKHTECKKAVGGWVDCCKSPGGVSLADYITAIRGAASFNSSMKALSANGESSWQFVGQAYTKYTGQDALASATSGFQETIKPVTNYIENITTKLTEAKQQVIDLADKLAAKAKETIAEAFGSTAIDTTGGAASGAMSSGEAASGVVEGAVSSPAGVFLQGVMAAYTAYVVANLIVNIVWKCTQDEFELGAHRDLKLCTFVGSYCKSKVLGQCVEKRDEYCCYTSPLSRIIQEQTKGQLGMPRNSCEGIPVSKLEQIDWDRVNLDEWLAILKSTGHLPSPGDLNLEKLTGAGSKYNFDGDRMNSLDRNIERLKDRDIDQTRSDTAKSVPISISGETGKL